MIKILHFSVAQWKDLNPNLNFTNEYLGVETRGKVSKVAWFSW